MAVKNRKRPVNNHVVNLITPMALDFNPSDMQVGDLLSRVITITNYPSRVNIGWLTQIANMEGATCSIHINPAESGKLIENISKSMGELQGRLHYNTGSALVQMRTEQQFKDAELLLQKIDQEQENVFYMNVSIKITGRDKEELDRKAKRIESSIAGSRMKGRTAMFKQEDGLTATSPYGICPQSIKDIGDRNMPVSTVAGSFPYNTSGLHDEKGMIFGKDSKGNLIILNPWLRGGDRTNSNFTILGVPGVGKSATVKHIFLNEYARDSKIIIIDPEREYKDLCKNLGGKWINCGGGSGGRINPLQIKDVPEDMEDEVDTLYEDKGRGLSPLSLHFQTLRTFFKLYVRSLDDMDQAILEDVLEELYAKHGITWTTKVENIPNTQYPILEDLYNLLVEKSNNPQERYRDIYDKLAILLKSGAIGADANLWNGHTTIEADSDFIVLDTHDLQEANDTLKRTQYFNVLTWAWQQLSKNREERVFLGVDEAYLLVDREVPQALQFLRNVSKRVRKYEGGLAVITHSVIDFLDPSVRRHGQALLDNPCFKFFMGSNGKGLEELTNLMDLTEAEQEMLAKLKRGHGLLIAGSKRIHAIVEISDHEFKYFGSGGGK